MRKVIVLNPVELSTRKEELLRSMFSEYVRILDFCTSFVPTAESTVELHSLTYSRIRDSSFLPSDIIQEARKDAWKLKSALKRNNYSRINIRSCSIRLNKRWFKYVQSNRGNPCFKITYSPRKTVVFPVATDNQFTRFRSFLSDGWFFDNISLLKDGKIAVVLEKEFSKPTEDKRLIVGVDVGSSTLAAVSVLDIVTGKVCKQLYLGRDVAVKQARFSERRSKLQNLADTGSDRAKKSLKRLKNNQRNYVKTRSGQVAKEIVSLARKYDASIAVEKLSIRANRNGKIGKDGRKKINRIPYDKFFQFLGANAEQSSIFLHKIDAYHTSKWCPHCGAVGDGHSKGNYALFVCKGCGNIVNSDRKASLAVAVKSVLERANSHLDNPSFAQISKTRAPVNGLLRPDAVGYTTVVVQHI